jgi:hypothetical protein
MQKKRHYCYETTLDVVCVPKKSPYLTNPVFILCSALLIQKLNHRTALVEKKNHEYHMSRISVQICAPGYITSYITFILNIMLLVV